jgi:tetratricopeptide (TPR) repeat protein
MKVQRNKISLCSKKLSLLLFIFFFSISSVIATDGDRKVDSLYKVLAKEKQDTSRIKLLNAIALEVCRTNMDSAIVICKRIIAIAGKINNKIEAARAHNFAGTLYFLKSDYPSGIKEQFAALKYAEAAGMEKFSGQILISIGNVFMMQGEYDKSLGYYHKAFDLFKKIDDMDDMARTYSNIGLVYAYQNKNKTALEYFEKSLEFREKAPNEVEKAITYDFIGFAYVNESDYEKAIQYLDASLIINRKLNSPIRILDNLRNRGEAYLKLKKFPQAEKDFKESLELSKKHGHLNGQEGNAILLYQLYKENKKFDLALRYYKEYIEAKDSIYSAENTSKTLRQEMNFEYAKKATADSVRVAEEKKIIAVQFKQEQTQRYALYGGLVLVGLFVLFTINRFLVTNRQKKIIEIQKKLVEEQKSIVDEKQKAILDSIHYARRIQRSLLSNENYINKHILRLKGK